LNNKLNPTPTFPSQLVLRYRARMACRRSRASARSEGKLNYFPPLSLAQIAESGGTRQLGKILQPSDVLSFIPQKAPVISQKSHCRNSISSGLLSRATHHRGAFSDFEPRSSYHYSTGYGSIAAEARGLAILWVQVRILLLPNSYELHKSN
jgi:hypothetical protein